MLPRRSRRLTARQRSRPRAPPPGAIQRPGEAGTAHAQEGRGQSRGDLPLVPGERDEEADAHGEPSHLRTERRAGARMRRLTQRSRLPAPGGARAPALTRLSSEERRPPSLLPLFLPARLRSLRGGRGVDTSGVLTMAPWSPWQREPSELSPSPAQSRPAGDRAQPPRGPPGGARASALGARSRSGKCISHDAPRAGSLWKAPTDRPRHPKPQRPTERMMAFPRGGSARGRYQSRQGARLSSPSTTGQATLRPREPRGTWAWTRWRVLTPLTLCGFATESKRI